MSMTRLYDAFSSVLISIMAQLCDMSSSVLMHKFIGKKETNTIKNIPCYNTTVSVYYLSVYVFH